MGYVWKSLEFANVQKMNFSIKDFFKKTDQIRSFLQKLLT